LKQEDANSCAICAEAKSGLMSDAFLSEMAGLRLARIVSSESSNFTIPSLGGLGNLHLLVCTRAHYPCLRDCDEAARKDLILSVSGIAIDLKRRFGGHTLIFENGSSLRNMDEPRCVDHTHIHIVHLDHRIESPSMMKLDGPEWVSLSEVDERKVETSNDYVVAGWDVDRMIILQAPDIQTQLMRRHIAVETGVGAEWNWRDYPRVESVRNSVKLLKRA
jgi:hypothetical protein